MQWVAIGFLLIKASISLKTSRASFSLGFTIAIPTPFYRGSHLHCLLILYPCGPSTALVLKSMLEAMEKHPLKVWAQSYDALFQTEKQQLTKA